MEKGENFESRKRKFSESWKSSAEEDDDDHGEEASGDSSGGSTTAPKTQLILGETEDTSSAEMDVDLASREIDAGAVAKSMKRKESTKSNESESMESSANDDDDYMTFADDDEEEGDYSGSSRKLEVDCSDPRPYIRALAEKPYPKTDEEKALFQTNQLMNKKAEEFLKKGEFTCFELMPNWKLEPYERLIMFRDYETGSDIDIEVYPRGLYRDKQYLGLLDEVANSEQMQQGRRGVFELVWKMAEKFPLLTFKDASECFNEYVQLFIPLIILKQWLELNCYLWEGGGKEDFLEDPQNFMQKVKDKYPLLCNACPPVVKEFISWWKSGSDKVKMEAKFMMEREIQLAESCCRCANGYYTRSKYIKSKLALAKAIGFISESDSLLW